jgi:hypothetical protein
MNRVELKVYTSEFLESVPCTGLNPYKMVELWKNYREHVDPAYHDDVLYQKPPAHVLALVKEERLERSVFRAKIKDAKVSGMKEKLESVAFGIAGEGNDVQEKDNLKVPGTEEWLESVAFGSDVDGNDVQEDNATITMSGDEDRARVRGRVPENEC